MTAADWSGDGIPDLLWVSPYGKGISAVPGPLKESEPITGSNEIDFKPKGYISDFVVVDWDGNGKSGLLVRQRLPDWQGKEGIYWYKNIGKLGRPKLADGKLVLEGEALVGGKSPDASVEGFCVCDWNGTRRPRSDRDAERVDAQGRRRQPSRLARDGLALPARIAASAASGKEITVGVRITPSTI